jgi:16S rRNA (cytosine967-C5)-methyltransferase
MDDLRRYALQMAERAPVYLRVNTAKATREEVQSALQTAGIVARSCPDVATALDVVEGARRLAQAEPFRAGQVELQDLSVQAAVLACPWPKSGRILDFCAGGGGKALAIAPLTQARLFAHDANPQRMRDLPDRARRAGVRLDPLAFDDLDRAGPFDAILCDVPCSGSGTWRRDPEARWRLSPQALDDLTRRQADILDQASDLLLPGGCLVYMTCSVFASENGDQIQRFLARRPGWRLTSSAQVGPWNLSDGFYHAVLRRPKNT